MIDELTQCGQNCRWASTVSYLAGILLVSSRIVYQGKNPIAFPDGKFAVVSLTRSGVKVATFALKRDVRDYLSSSDIKPHAIRFYPEPSVANAEAVDYISCWRNKDQSSLNVLLLKDPNEETVEAGTAFLKKRLSNQKKRKERDYRDREQRRKVREQCGKHELEIVAARKVVIKRRREETLRVQREELIAEYPERLAEYKRAKRRYSTQPTFRGRLVEALVYRALAWVPLFGWVFRDDDGLAAATIAKYESDYSFLTDEDTLDI